LAFSLIRPRREHAAGEAREDIPAPALLKGDSVKGISQTTGEASRSNGPLSTMANSALDDIMPSEQDHRAPAASTDVDMDALVDNMASSLQFLPKGVRKKLPAKS